MNEATKRLVRARAGDRCEYCLLLQTDSPLARLQVEHILPRKHGGGDDAENLALACIDCNLHKGANLAGMDVESGQLTPCTIRELILGMSISNGTAFTSSERRRWVESPSTC